MLLDLEVEMYDSFDEYFNYLRETKWAISNFFHLEINLNQIPYFSTIS